MGEFSDEFAGESIRSWRTRGTLHGEATREVLRNRAQKAAAGPVENEQAPWEVEAMEYFKERLDWIHESMVRAFSGVMAEQNRLHTRIDALVESIAEAKPKPTSNVTITLDASAFDGDMESVQQLVDELDKRVKRISKGKSGEAGR